MRTSGALDPDRLAELRALDGGVGAVLARIARLYRESTPALVAGLRPEFEAGHIAELAAAAHKLKGSSGSLGAQRMREACLALELAAKANDAASLGGCIAAVENALAPTLAELAALLAAIENGTG